MMKVAAALLSVVGTTAQHDPIIHPPQASVPAGWEMTGENADTTGRMDVLVGLRRSNLDKLQEVFDESSTPGSKGFLKHVSWKEMGDMIRPSEDAIGAVVGMLASNGGINIRVGNHGDYIKASVPMQSLETLTHGNFETFVNKATGQRLARLADGVRLPAAIAKHVETFSGLHGFPLDASPLVGNATASNYVTPTVINAAYGIDKSTVKRSGHANIQAIGQFQGQYVSPRDLSYFCEQYDATANCSIAKFIGKNIGTSAPGIESMLDVEYITGVAQGVTTWVYSYPSFDFCADLLTWASDVAAESEHPYVVSLSYGSQKIEYCDKATMARLSTDVQKLGAMGITVVIASGDDGSGGISRQGSNNGKLSPSFPASIPYALAVGSTFFDTGLSGEEKATTQFGSGGGFSYDYDMPAYQTSAVQAYLAKNPKTGTGTYTKTGRASPDVALLGEQFAVVAGFNETSTQSGTSASTPSWGAVISLLNEECLSASGGKKTLGFVNPLFYQNAEAFTDITKGSNAVGENANSGWTCTEGWDAVTGLGTPQFPKLQDVVRKACGSSNVVVV